MQGHVCLTGNCQERVSANPQSLLPLLREDATEKSINDEGKQINKEPMHPIVDPLLDPAHKPNSATRPS